MDKEYIAIANDNIGAVAQYRLLWVLLLAHILGFFLQRLSARLGVTSGRNLAEMVDLNFP